MSDEYELQREKRDKVIGFKVTKSEFKKIEDYCKRKNTNISRLVRHVVMNEIK